MPARPLARTAATALAALAVAAPLVALTAAPASALDLQRATTSPGGYAVYVVKDLGGGAYWNVTTNSQYVADTSGGLAVSTVTTASQTGSEMLATAVDDGRGALLLVNGTVLVPLQKALGL